MTMSELFNNPSHGGSEQVNQKLYENMVEGNYLEMKRLMEAAQEEYDQLGDNEASQEDLLINLHEEITELDMNVFDRKVMFSAKVRPEFSEAEYELNSLTDEGDSAVTIAHDNLGPYVYLTNVTGFQVSQPGPILTEEGEKIGLIIEDDFDNTFAILPNEIVRFGEDDQSIETIFREVEALYPDAAENIRTLTQADTDKAFIKALAELQITIPEHCMHEDNETVARKLGRYATALVNLDDAPHTISFKGDYSVMDGYGDFESNAISNTATVTADLNAIDMDTYKDGDSNEYIFEPDLNISVGLPGKMNAYATMRVPAENIRSFTSTRMKDMSLFNGNEIAQIDRPVEEWAPVFYGGEAGYDDDSLEEYQREYRDFTSSNEYTGYVDNDLSSREAQLRDAFDMYRTRLEESYESMQRFVEGLREVHYQEYDAEDSDITGVIEELCNTVGAAAFKNQEYWRYVGDGVITSGTVARGSMEPTFAMASGSLGPVVAMAEYRQDADGDVERVATPYLIMGRMEPGGSSVTTVEFEVENVARLPLEQEHTSKQQQMLLRVADLQEAPMPFMLDGMRRRDAALATAIDTYGQDSDIAECIDHFVTAYNLNVVNAADEYVQIPLAKLTRTLEAHPELAEEVRELLADVITRSVARIEGAARFVYAQDSDNLSTEPSESIITGVCSGDVPGFEGESLVFLAEMDGKSVYVPLSGLQDLQIGDSLYE